MFTDHVRLKLVAGKGGNGVVAWRREKYVPKGGPSGGNGGKGGDVIVQACSNTFSLEAFRNRKVMKADNGGEGGGNKRRGKNGQDCVVKVPCGTLLKTSDEEEILFDFTEEGQRFVICEGGIGGRGNESYKTPTNRAPNYCTKGQDGKSNQIVLELKLIADVGFVGFPNAGKSTMIASMTNIPVKVAPYPFTTLRPNLGYVQFEDYTRILLADIPGIIKGAHNNKGLGLEFLRHIERTKVLVYVLDLSGIDGRDPFEDLEVLQEELSAYSGELPLKSFVIALNKTDEPEAELFKEEFYKRYQGDTSLLYEISAIVGEGLPELTEALRALVKEKRNREVAS